MEMKIESMKNMKKVVEKCLDGLMAKSDLTPAETKAALDGFRLYDELCCRIEDCKMEEDYSQRGYSGHEMPYRQYRITSYGRPDRMYSGTPQYGVHGWYQNNTYRNQDEYARGYYGDSYNGYEYSDRSRGYSRHSISDRVVSMVERMMDTAESDYERQELQKYIKAIRAMGMND